MYIYGDDWVIVLNFLMKSHQNMFHLISEFYFTTELTDSNRLNLLLFRFTYINYSVYA